MIVVVIGAFFMHTTNVQKQKSHGEKYLVTLYIDRVVLYFLTCLLLDYLRQL